MNKLISSSVKNLENSHGYRGHVDGLRPDGKIRGWAFLASDPFTQVSIDLHIMDIKVSSVTTSLIRADISKLLELNQAGKFGFEFDMLNFDPTGSLELLKKIEFRDIKFDLMTDFKFYISNTNDFLPMGKRCQGSIVDAAEIRPHLINKANKAIRQIMRFNPETVLSLLEQKILLTLSPLFNEEWYISTYGDVPLTGVSPIEHYIRVGGSLGRDPGPWFDAQAYLTADSRAHDADMSPLVHYELNGSEKWWPGMGRFRNRNDISFSNDYALVIHLSHLDTVHDVKRLIDQFPEDADIFITIPTDFPDHDNTVIESLFPQAKIFQVPYTENDTGAFLEATRLIAGRGYKFLCKVSSHKGDVTTDLWRKQMFDAVGGNSERIKDIINRFRNDERLILVGPKDFWFDSKELGESFSDYLDKIMVDIGLESSAEHINWCFFAGSCFWVDSGFALKIAEVIIPEFLSDEDKDQNKNRHISERIFGLMTAVVGGHISLSDGYDLAMPVSPGELMPDPVDVSLIKSSGKLLREHIVSNTRPKKIDPTKYEYNKIRWPDLFPNFDSVLHSEIDVIVSCWIGNGEPMHYGLASLHETLCTSGLTSAFLFGGKASLDFFEQICSATSLLEPIGINVTPIFEPGYEILDCQPLDREFVHTLLQSECLFRNTLLPTGSEYEDAVLRVQNIYAIWRENLIRHRVKMFLIWGNTAPKSRLFINLCNELNIEYQIIERGHFPSTITCDPMGQFGFGARPMMLDHCSILQSTSEINHRFDEISSWHIKNAGQSAYSNYHRKSTSDIQRILKAKEYGRPVILVIGANDAGAGVIEPSNKNKIRPNWFNNSDNLFSTVRSIVAQKFPDAVLVMRPHPSHEMDQDEDFVILANDTSLNDLIDCADICIAVATSAAAFCVLKGKHVIALGLTEVNDYSAVVSINDETELLPTIRQMIENLNKNEGFIDEAQKRYVVDIFDRYLIGVDKTVPTRADMTDFGAILSKRISRKNSGFLISNVEKIQEISRKLENDIASRGRVKFRVDPWRHSNNSHCQISVIVPVYGDFEGTSICLEQLQKYSDVNGYRVITVWDRGPDLRLEELCERYARDHKFTYIKNSQNLGFSGTVNAGIIAANQDDVILINSDAIPFSDWALRLHMAAYSHPKIGTVSPFSNNASICNVPFPNGFELGLKDSIKVVERIDEKARSLQPFVLESPVSHGFCVYIRRNILNKIGLFDEIKFNRGYGEDNEFSMRARSSGFFCGTASNVFVGHAGSTSFSDSGESLKIKGRETLNREFPYYMKEIQDFFANDPFEKFRSFVDVGVI